MKVSSKLSWIDLIVVTSPQNCKHLDKKDKSTLPMLRFSRSFNRNYAIDSSHEILKPDSILNLWTTQEKILTFSQLTGWDCNWVT